ncbi:MAG TPA: alpha/beta hydrolase-fold protein [Luteolibacter sp.]|nr:alpha/beta hydrolase-fold protein [Luteolibacter sp.]
MTSFTLRDSKDRFIRKARFLPAKAPASRLAVFLDAEYYIDQMETPALIETLVDSGDIPPVACLFISNEDAEARHHDYTCSDPFADYLAKEVMPWFMKQAGVTRRGGHLIAGLSLSGLQSAYTSLCFPDIFSATLSQSGSFWWENEWFARHLRELLPNPGKYWLSVGTKEQGAGLVHPPTDLEQNVDQDVAVHRFAKALANHGSQIHENVFEGGHATAHWKAELNDALKWLLDDQP